MLKKILLSTAFASSLYFMACGDESGSDSGSNAGTEVKGETITLADGSGEKICDSHLDGWVAEATGKDFRRCVDGEWVKISAKEAANEDEIIGVVTVLQSSSSVKEDLLSSSSVARSSATSSSSAQSSSSAVSSSSAKSSSSSAQSSSSAVSSSSVKSSSSVEKPYLNPNISYGELVDSRDNRVYKTVKIGEQTWMAENLAKDFVLLDHPYRPSVFSPSATKVLKSGYGFYYTWAAAVDSAGIYSDAGKGCGYSYNRNCKYEGKVVRGICPEGWHLPKQEEFETLIAAVSDDPKGAGAALVSEAERSSLLAMGTNSSGFSAVMTGYYKVSKLSTVMENKDEVVNTNRAYFWTINSTDGGRSGSYCLELWYQELKTRFFDCLKDSGSNSGMTIRCVMD